MVSRAGVLTPWGTRGQLQARLAGFGGRLEGHCGVQARLGWGRSRPHRHCGVHVGRPQRLPGATRHRGQHPDTLPLLTFLFQSLLLGDDGKIVDKLLLGLGSGQLVQHLRNKYLIVDKINFLSVNLPWMMRTTVVVMRNICKISLHSSPCRPAWSGRYPKGGWGHWPGGHGSRRPGQC